jgi:dimethylargininase
MNFRHAITRLPANTFSQGISSSKLGQPDIDLAIVQHQSYVSALSKAGLDCLVLPASPEFPDSVFVEDTAVVTRDFAVISRPGADSRRGEIIEMTVELEKFFQNIEQIQAPGMLDGGDICMADNHFFIGISNRTNPAGAQQLADIVNKYGFTSKFIDIRQLAGILHLKSSVNYLGEETLLLDPRMQNHPALQRFRRLVVPADEVYSANCLRVNEIVLVPDGFPGTLEILDKAGFLVVVVDVSEYQKMDGGLSCLSLRW